MSLPLMHFEEHEPRESLKPYVSRWINLHLQETEDYFHKIAPSGRIIMIQTYGAYVYSYTDSNEEIIYENKTYFKGHRLKSPLRVKQTNGVKEFGCEFTYTGFYRLFGKPASRLVDIEYEIADFGHGVLNKALFQTDHIDQKLNVAQDYFEALLENAEPADPVIEEVISTIESGNYETLASLQHSAPADKKKFYRKFKKQTGLSIKQFKRIHQMNTAVKLMNTGDFESLTELGHKAGYYDQADFIKHIKHFLGENPKQIVKNDQDILFKYMGGPEKG